MDNPRRSADAPTAASGPALTELMRQELAAGAAALDITLEEEALVKFDRYLAELLAWNGRHNLTAIREPGAIVRRHFLDSLTCVKGYNFHTGRPVIDVGTGAGFPGLPLKIMFPELRLSLLDSSIKKVEFLKHLCQALGLSDVDIAHGRAEELGHVGSYRSGFHLCLARSLASLPVLAELCLPFVAEGGYFLAQKNRDLGDEWVEGARAIAMLGGGEPEVIEVPSPGEEPPRALIRVRKEDHTPSAYPRRPGIPEKRPLGKEDARGQRKHNKFG
ncbi:MAG: 16S rRNA (guanine(527)-N(7))-methyltransferase RsmG [Chloroflexi bacterium]|nr:16S rRNA (guanine(527)-N(7))-methyltransferase RsmG [Chloroflexota bacterium]